MAKSTTTIITALVMARNGQQATFKQKQLYNVLECTNAADFKGRPPRPDQSGYGTPILAANLMLQLLAAGRASNPDLDVDDSTPQMVAESGGKC